MVALRQHTVLEVARGISLEKRARNLYRLTIDGEYAGKVIREDGAWGWEYAPNCKARRITNDEAMSLLRFLGNLKPDAET